MSLGTHLAVGVLNLSPLIYAFIAVLALFGAIVGLWRGFLRQTVRFTTVILSLLLSYTLVLAAYGYIDAVLCTRGASTLGALLVRLGIFTRVSDLLSLFGTDVTALLLELPSTFFVIPCIFVVTFIFFSSLLIVAHKIICAICGFRSHRNTLIMRLLGAFLGVIQALFVSAVILTPIVGVSSLARDAVRAVNEKAPGESITVRVNNAYDTYLKSVTENSAITSLEKFGIDAIYRGISNPGIDGKELPTKNIIDDGASLLVNLARIKGADFDLLTEDDKAAINEIIAVLENNPYYRNLAAATVKSVADSYEDGKINLPIGEPLLPFAEAAISIFTTSNEANICNDIKTMRDVLFILSDEGVFESFDKGSDAMLSALTSRDDDGSTAVSKVISVIDANERTAPLKSVVAKISVTVMADKSGISEDAADTYENIKNAINSDVLSIEKSDYETEEEYVEEISSALDTVLKNNDISLDGEIVDGMAKYVADNFSDISEIGDREASDIIFSYYDAYLEYMESGMIPDGIIP